MNMLLEWVTAMWPKMSNIVIYGAIAMVTLIGVCKCLLPLWSTTAALRRAIAKLQDEAGTKTDHPVWQEPRFVGKRLKGSWLRFLQNAEQLDRRGLPCDVEDYINDDTVTHGPGNAQLAELIPSLLTSLGILGTFMGMTSGLSGLDPTSTEKMMEGIKVLLSGMTFAFGTSVAGVSCSLVFNMLNRIAQGSSYRAIDEFVESFTQLAMERPLDNDVQLVCQNQDRNTMLGTLTETMPRQLSSSIEVSVSRALTPVAQSMDRFLQGATRAQIDGISRITAVFVDQMNQSLSGQLLALGQTMSDVNRQVQVSNQQIQDSMAAASLMMNDVQRLQGISQEVLSRFEKYIAELGDARKRDAAFEHTSAEVLSSLTHSAETQSVTANRIRACQDELARTVKDVADTALSLDRGEKERKEAMAELSRGYERFVTDAAAQSDKALSSFTASMDKLSALLAKNAENGIAAGETQRLLADILSALEKTGGKE